MSSCGAGFQPARRAKARLHTATLQVVESCVAVEQDHPEVIAPPPLIFFVTFMIGYLCRNFLPRAGSPPVGAAIAVIGMIIGAFALTEFLRVKTHVDPRKPATALVTSGPYRFSRNPIYVATTLLYIGAALSFRIISALVLLPLALILLEFGVIRREERYLEQKFGDRYREYRSSVRRWI